MEQKIERITPDVVTELASDEFFVFGSNLQGNHLGGAACIAYEKFGAVWGEGVGLQGQSYAIPTMHGPLSEIKPYIDEFIEFAKLHPAKHFLVTRIGCGIAGFKDEEIAPMFMKALPLANVALPKNWFELLESKKNPIDRPYIICHIMSLLDGRIDCAVTEKIESGDEYYEALELLDCPSTLMGRVTMQMHYASPEPFQVKSATPIGCEGYYMAVEAPGYLVAIDTMGKLSWPQNKFDDMPLLVIASEDCPKEYFETLTQQEISWIAVGKNKIDLPKAMTILFHTFRVERLSVTGGGNINAAFLKAGLLDEVSMMWCPGIDGRGGMTTAFDGLEMDFPPTKLQLESVVRMGETIWARYLMNDNN